MLLSICEALLQLGLQGWDSLTLLQGPFGSFGPKVAKWVWKEFPEPLGPKYSKNWPLFNYFASFSHLFWTFWAPGQEGPGNSFCHSEPEGPKQPAWHANILATLRWMLLSKVQQKPTNRQKWMESTLSTFAITRLHHRHQSRCLGTTLIFLSLLFNKRQGKPAKKNKDFCSLANP